MPGFRWSTRLPLLLALAALATPVLAYKFPPITEQERALTQVPSDPGAPAVVLFEIAELKIMDYPREVSSFLEVQVRLKILTEEGKEHGEVSIRHSAYNRLKSFEGRTVLPDGREVPLREDAVFEQRSSRARKRYVTKAAFPAVEVGAIVDYRYVQRWDDIFFLEPWYFSNRIPTLVSEFRFVRPANMSVHPWAVQVGRKQFQVSEKQILRGTMTRLRMENIPGVPEEPFSFPFADLSTQFMAVPKEVFRSSTRVALLDSWETVCANFETGMYSSVRRKNDRAEKLAVELAAGASSSREKITAIYTFVRDDVRTLSSDWVGVSDDAGVDRVLAEKQGRSAEKALLVQAMLAAVKVKSRLVWAADRQLGRIYPEVANPWWFDKVLVLVELDGERIFLDPSDRRLAFGR
ncbi:MAG: DUF3857 and transglutaminase domain-containing protein, partial [bacterium]|nr:DUF3857 and transglutaminase domain-containing protein [bacterium]